MYLFGKGVLKDGEQIENITDEEWRQKLTDQQYYVCRQHGTEMVVLLNFIIYLFIFEIFVLNL